MDQLSQESIDKVRAAVRQELDKNAQKGRELLDQHEQQIKQFGEVQENTKSAVAELNDKTAAAMKRLQDLEAGIAELRANGGTIKGAGDSIGEQFVKSEEFKSYVAKSANKGASSGRFAVKEISSLPTSAGAGIARQRVPDVIVEPLQGLTIRDLLDNGRTASNLIEFVREDVFTNNAEPVTEGTLKPESNITYEDDTRPVRTVAHWMRASKQVLADFPQLASLIDGRLRYGLKLAEERQLLLGDGTGQNLLGLLPQSTPYDVALNRPGDTMIDTIRHAMLQVRLAYYPASGVVMNPTSWHDLELTKDANQRYIIAQPYGRIQPVIWGLPVVEADSLQAGGFLVGAFRLAATVWDREDAGVYVSNEDRDNFVTNRVTILAEERLALTVFRPRAIVYGGFPAGSTT